MIDEYPLYDAKAKLSALVRQVRDGRTIIITVHGERVAELRPYQEKPGPQTLADRYAELHARGEIIPSRLAPGEVGSLRVGTPHPGVLQRFLDERD
jgi:prevent-host-death family protein